MADMSNEDWIRHARTMAVHEAGHAIAGIDVGWSILKLQLEPTIENGRQTFGYVRWADKSQASIDKVALVLTAGWAAEQMFAEELEIVEDNGGWEGDLAELKAEFNLRAPHALDSEIAAVWLKAQSAAMDHLREHATSDRLRKLCNAIFEAIESRKTHLSGEEVMEAIGKS